MAADFSQTTRSLRRDSSRAAFAAWAAAGVLFAAWLAWLVNGRVGVYEVSTSARVEVTASSHPVTSLASGKVLSSSLAVGRRVRAGEVLAVIDSSDGRLRLDEEDQKRSGIRSQVDALKRQIQSREQARTADASAASAARRSAEARRREAEAAVVFADEFERKTRQLHAFGLVASLEVEKAAAETNKLRAARDALAAEAERSALDAEVAAKEHDASIEAVQTALALLEGEGGSADAVVARLSGDLERRVARAPVAGRLGDVAPVQPGTYVTEGQVLAQIVPEGPLMVVADFDPARARGRVRPGQHGQVRLDGFPWTQYGTVPVTVTRVSSEVRQGLLRVELAIAGSPGDASVLEHGLPGRVDVRVEETTPVTLVLRAAGLLLSGGGQRHASAGTAHAGALP
ncbi:MAG: HlyD family secretion protein [Vicinamibacterales bacterium]